MASKVLVAGSGAAGLRTALELLRRNVPVFLRSARPPLHPSTCSSGAGGLWMPYHCDDPRTERWAAVTLDDLLHEEASGASTADNSSAVEIIPVVVLKRDHCGPSVGHFMSEEYDRGRGGGSPLPGWTSDPRLAFQHLTVEMLSWQNKVHRLRIPSQEILVKEGYLHAWFFHSPIVDAPLMLQRMLSEVELHPLTQDVDVDSAVEYKSLQEMVDDATTMGCDAVVNCTGLGAKNIASDANLIGGRGVLLQYDRSCERRKHFQGGDGTSNDAVIITEEAPWGSETEPCYLIPRGDTLVVGGTYLEGDTEPQLRPEERERLKRNAHLLGVDTNKASSVGEWTGFRPYRATVRLEVDPDAGVTEGVKVVHNYGHGGSGWTVFVGAAKEAASLAVSNNF